MKAKDYISKYIKDDNYDIKSVSSIIKGLLSEMVEIREKRNIQNTASYNSLVQEIRQKWRAICKLAKGNLKTDEGFFR